MTNDNKFAIEGVAAHAGIGSLASDEGQIKGVETHAVVADMSMPTAALTGVSATASVGQLRVEIHEPLPQENPIYQLVGRVASEWSHYEHVLDSIIWRLSGLEPPIGACITAQLMGAGNRLVTIELLAEELGLLAEIGDRLEALKRKTFGPQERRNRAIHDPWFLEKITDTPMQHRSKPKKEPVYGFVSADEGELKKLTADINRLWSEALDLYAVVRDSKNARLVQLNTSR